MRLRPIAMALGLWLLGAACEPREPARVAVATPPRAGRFGSLRDFVLLAVPGAGPGSTPRHLFVDRFEVTRGDWLAFAATSEGQAVGASGAVVAGDPAMPVGRVDLRQARAFARWRFARLPTAAEWAAAVGDGRTRFPWGDRVDPARANTGELGLLEPLPAGTFESGRRGLGWPYDLIGNVAEWSESVPVGWWGERYVGGDGAAEVPGIDWETACRRVLALPALAIWQALPGTVPALWPVCAGGEEVPREAMGADFQSAMTAQSEPVLAGDRRLRLGLRLVVAPSELLGGLLAYAGEPVSDDLEQLRRFLLRPGHAAALSPAWQGLSAKASGVLARPVGRLLASVLGSPGSGSHGR